MSSKHSAPPHDHAPGRAVPTSAPRPTDLRDHLRRETAAAHAALEAELDLVSPDLALDRYRRVLRAFYGFYAPVEAQLGAVAPPMLPDDLPLRLRAPLLARDLVALGDPDPAAGPPAPGPLPRLRDREHVAGCLYVIEGACLGGQLIARALHRHLDLTPDRGAAFFAGDGAGTGARWQRVVAWLNAVGARAVRADEAVAAANASFEGLAHRARAQGATR